MEFKLEKANYEIEKIKFNVDGIFNDKIKPPFPNASFFLTIIGKPGSGKTNLLVNMLTNKNIYKRVFDKVLLVMPKNSIKSLKNNIFEDLPEAQQFNELSPDVFDTIKQFREEFDEVDEDAKKKPRSKNMLLILDDITAQLKEKENQKLLIELSTNRRHLKLSIILISQYLRAIPRCVRSQTTNLVYFKPANELDNNIVRDEYINLPKETFNNLMRFVFQNQHDFLFIDKNNESYFKNLNKIIFA
jgi:Cdc6-like AAA superfamily ATPase